MADHDIKFSDFLPETRRILDSALRYALTDVETMPVMFNSYGQQSEPTPGMSQLSSEILRDTLTFQTIFMGTEVYIAKALSYVLWRLECPLDDTEHIRQTLFSSPLTPDMLLQLECLARSIAPHAEIYSTRDITKYNNLQEFRDLFIEQVADSTEVNYGQRNIGIVVNNTMYDFAPEHPLIKSLLTMLQCNTKAS